MISNLIDTRIALFRQKFYDYYEDDEEIIKTLIDDDEAIEAFLKESMLLVKSQVKEKMTEKVRSMLPSLHMDGKTYILQEKVLDVINSLSERSTG